MKRKLSFLEWFIVVCFGLFLLFWFASDPNDFVQSIVFLYVFEKCFGINPFPRIYSLFRDKDGD